jgi:hypothetical protein
LESLGTDFLYIFCPFGACILDILIHYIHKMIRGERWAKLNYDIHKMFFFELKIALSIADSQHL